LTGNQMVPYDGDMDRVFDALADESRRKLLDPLYQESGMRLSDLCAFLDMSRQAVAKHLLLLEDAGLVISVHKGREKWYYLNSIPLRRVYDRWLRRFDEPRAAALTPEGAVKVHGKVVEFTPPKRLSYTGNSLALAAESQVVFEVQEMGPLVKISIFHDLKAGSAGFEQAANGWTFILNSFKTLLETGTPLPSLPWKKG